MKPILFNTEMVRAILDGRKTATRRIVKPQPPATSVVSMNGPYAAWRFWEDDPQGHLIKPPYRQGDLLYVRETWCQYGKLDDSDRLIEGTEKYYYRADGENPTPFNDFLVQHPGWDERREMPIWHPSIHMPSEAARIFLRITSVRVERLQDMTEEDAFSEGYGGTPWCEHPVFENYPDSPIPCYAAANPGCQADAPCNHSIPELFGHEIWDSTVKTVDRDKYGWDANPWVWVIQFEQISKEEVTRNG